MSLTIAEMPTSFTGQALFYSARIEWLEPHHRTFRGRNTIVIILGFTASLLARTVYNLGVGAILAPAGVVYHTAMAIQWKWSAFWLNGPQGKARAIAWEHFKAAATDLTGIAVAIPLLYPILGYYFTNKALMWWFSSAKVQTGYPTPAFNFMIGPEQNRMPKMVSSHWGAVDCSTAQACSYSRLHQQAVKLFEGREPRLLELHDPELLQHTVMSDWKSAAESSDSWTFLWPKTPSLSPEACKFKKGIEAPQYTTPWRTIAYATATVALIALLGLFVVWIASLHGSSLTRLFNQEIAKGIIALGTAIGICYHNAMKAWIENRGSAEKALADRLMTEAFQERLGHRSKKAEAALFWLTKAVSRAYVPAQRTLGLSLLASLGSKSKIRSLGSQELRVLRDGISCLQAAAKNKDEEAQTDLRQLFRLNWPRISSGVVGNTEDERTRDLSRQNPKFLRVAARRYAALYPGEEQQAVRANLPQVLMNPRRAIIAERVTETTGLLPDLAEICARLALDVGGPA